MDKKIYDGLINVALTNSYSLGKDNKRILLYNINIKDERHLAYIHIVSIVSLFDYWKLRRKCKSKKWLKRIKVDPSVSYTLLDVEDFISHIEKANDMKDVFAEIYREYYKEYDR